MQAVVSDGPGKLRLATDIPKPEVDAGKVLVRVDAVALNHSDWKMADFSAKVGAISGFDMAGTVVETFGGDSSGREKALSAGDPVLGATGIHGGAFAEYVLMDSDFVVKVPPGMPQENAATFGVGLVTTGLALYSSEFLGLEWPSTAVDGTATTAATTTTTLPLVTPRGWSGSASDDDEDDVQGSGSCKTPVLVYGASSATGTLALQLLRSSGYEAIAVCSPRNFRLVQSRGATKCFDYHSSACAAQIKQYTKNRLALVLDCITTASSMRLAYDAMGTTGGKYVSLDPFSARVQRTRTDIKAAFCYALTAFGLPIELDGEFARPAKLDDRKLVVKFMKTAETLIAEGKLEPHPAALQQGGLAGIIDTIDMLRKGKVSGQKLVFKVA